MSKYSILALSVLALSFIGLTNALYLVQAYTGVQELACSIGGCTTVADSPYSSLFGVSLSSLGALFFLGLFVLSAGTLLIRSTILSGLVFLAAGVGALFSLYFMYLQFFVIQAICIYCLLSAVVSILTFGVAWTLYRETKRANVPKIIPIIPPLYR